MKPAVLVVFACAAALAVGACDQTKRMLGQTKRAPDEFAVYSRAPLSLPPDYSLRVPEPGADRPQTGSTRDEALRALDRNAGKAPAQAVPAGATAGERLLLQATGAPNAEPNIRSTLNRETTLLAEADTTLADKILFWRKPDDGAVVLNAGKEAQRIQENQALGKPITEGETPVIERRRKALLEGIFN